MQEEKECISDFYYARNTEGTDKKKPVVIEFYYAKKM